jgi:hypothetical protein
MVVLLTSKFKTKFNFKDKKLLFLLTINIVPIILMFLTSMLIGVKIRTMWMTPFYLFFGVLIIYIFQSQINLNKLKSFTSVFLILFIFSPFAYAYVSITQTDKRTDFLGKVLAEKVQQEMNNAYVGSSFTSIENVCCDEWLAGNLSYHLKSRPKSVNFKKVFQGNNNVIIQEPAMNLASDSIKHIFVDGKKYEITIVDLIK